MIRAVLDTNVLVAALRSRTGAAYELLSLLRQGRWALVLSNTVLGEYHEVLHREHDSLGLNHAQVNDYLDVLCALSEQCVLASPWEPVAGDPDDEALVQLARESRAVYLVTHNVRHVSGATRFGVQVVRPSAFLNLVKQTI